ncbi:hypothetical protein MHU86_14979 [Fragilaria crotonensis]|nr:hypothetical protein MHU86_14979 [Fragilaria crotonensis]
MTSSISLLRDALSKSLESTASSTPTKHKKHVTYCGYCYFANGSWQIRFKPYGVSVSVGVLGGNQAVPTTHNPSQWLGRLDLDASTDDVEKDRVPPADLVLIVLKRAELRNVLQLTRKQVEHGRKQFQKLLVVKLRDETEFDMAPVLREILGEDQLCKHRTLAMLDYALAYIKSTSFPGLQMHVDGWKLTLSGKPMLDTEYQDVEPVKNFVTACLNPGTEKSNQDYAEKLTNDCRQVAGAATCESSSETPRSAMDITTPFGVAMKGLQVRFLMDEQPMLRTPPSRRQLISISPGNGVSMIVEKSDEQVTDRDVGSGSDRRIVAAPRSVTETTGGSRDLEAEISPPSRNCGEFEELYKTCKPGIESPGQEDGVVRVPVNHVELQGVSRKEQCQNADLEATTATPICDREEPEEKVQPSGYAVPPESADSTAIPTNAGKVDSCAVEVDPEIQRKFTENGAKTPDIESHGSAASGIIGYEVTEKLSDRVRGSTLEDRANSGGEAMISTRSAHENGRVETELKPEYISGFLKRLSNEGNESGFISPGDIGLYVENALISPQLLTDYSVESGAIEPEFNDCLGEGHFATASDAAEILALTSNGSFDIQDDDGRHDHVLVGDGHVDQMEMCELREPIEVVRAPSIDETPAEIIEEATSATYPVENECHDTMQVGNIHPGLTPKSLVPFDDSQTTLEDANRIQENVRTAVHLDEFPDNNLRSPSGTTLPQDNDRGVTYADRVHVLLRCRWRLCLLLLLLKISQPISIQKPKL